MATNKLEGGCQCGNVRYLVSGEAVMSAICHCTMCRKAHAAPAVGWAMFTDSQVTFTAASPKQFQSSDPAKRGFCPECGTQICFTAEFLPGMIDVSIGSLDDPEAIVPLFHYWHSAHLSWVNFDDDLPRHPELPPFGEE